MSPHLENIRKNTNYPTYRAFVRIGGVIGVVAAALFGITILVLALFNTPSADDAGQALLLLVAAVVAVLAFKALMEFSLMLADIADVLVEGSKPRDANEHEDAQARQPS